MFERLKKAFNSFTEKVSTQELTGRKLDEILDEFKLVLIESDVALSVADKIVEDLKQQTAKLRVGRLEDKKKHAKTALQEVLTEVLTPASQVDLLKLAEKRKLEKKPLIIVFAGINGTGKTTTIAKVTKLLMNHGFSVVMACSDTYRAGAIEQLEEHAQRLSVKLIKHEYGSDAASVAFDAIAHAQARKINIVLVDTAGRMETNLNLMDEMRKIVEISKADLVIFVGDALAGNDAVMQAQEFNDQIGINASILTKMDADAKGGAAISIAHTTGKPIIYIGVGQRYSDLIPFDPKSFINQMLEKVN